MCSAMGPEVEENKGVTFRSVWKIIGLKCIALGRVEMKSMVKEVGGGDARQAVSCKALTTLRTGPLNCLNARSRRLTFRHRASCI